MRFPIAKIGDNWPLPEWPTGTPEIPVIPVWDVPEEGEEADEETLTLFQLALQTVGDWIVDAIVRPAIEGATWLLNWIRAELRYWIYEFQKYVAEFTSTTEGMIVTLAIVIAAAVCLPQIVEVIASSSVGKLIRNLIDWTTEKVGNILEAIHFIDLIAIHEALLFLWPTWKEIFAPFQNAISALAEQLGQGTGYLHAWFSVAHGMSMVGTSLLNLEPEIGEIRAMEQTVDFMEDLDEKLRAYQHDPGLILRDIVERIYIPQADEIRDTQVGTIDSIQEARDHLLNVDTSLGNLDDSIEQLIDATLPEFREDMEDNFAGIRDTIDTFKEWIEGTLLPSIDVTVQILEERAYLLEQANEVARAKMANPIEIYRATEFQDQATQLATYRYIEEMVEKASEEAQEDFSETTEEGRDRYIEATAKVIMETQAPPFLRLELPTGRLPAAKEKSRIPRWNVGEY